MSVQTILAAGFLFLGGVHLQTFYHSLIPNGRIPNHLVRESGLILAFIGAAVLLIHLIRVFVRWVKEAIRWFNEKYPPVTDDD